MSDKHYWAGKVGEVCLACGDGERGRGRTSQKERRDDGRHRVAIGLKVVQLRCS
jgi:hypothetical protein